MTPEVQEPVLVMPGDVISEAQELAKQNSKVVLGPGVQRVGDRVFACKPGILRRKDPPHTTFWVDSFQKRYTASRGETVIGTVIGKGMDGFRVDIGTSEPAALSFLSFEGATKKNKPDVNLGDIVFARLVLANPDLEPEIVCVDSFGKKEKLGVLNEGFVFNVSLNLVRRILSRNCPLLRRLKKEFNFELAAGMNGRMWIKGRNSKETIGVANAILASEFVPYDQIDNMCNSIGNILAGF